MVGFPGPIVNAVLAGLLLELRDLQTEAALDFILGEWQLLDKAAHGDFDDDDRSTWERHLKRCRQTRGSTRGSYDPD